MFVLYSLLVFFSGGAATVAVIALYRVSVIRLDRSEVLSLRARLEDVTTHNRRLRDEQAVLNTDLQKEIEERRAAQAELILLIDENNALRAAQAEPKRKTRAFAEAAA